MRIGHLLPYNPAQPGGVQTHTTALHRALRDLNHDSTLFTPQHPLRLPVGGTRADFSLHPADLLRLRTFLNQPHDILHLQEPFLPLLGPLALLHPSPAKLVLTLHSAEPAAARFYRLTQPLTKRLLARADAVLCASAVTRSAATPALPPHTQIIPPCVNLAPFQAVPRPAAVHDPHTLLFLGRDEPRKGLPILLHALDQLPHARLLIAGPVRRREHPRAVWLGPVPHDQLPALLQQADAAVFPALGGEALGLVLIECLAAGLPVAASDIDGYRLASADGQAALLSPPGDAPALAASLRRLLTDLDLRQRLTEHGRRQAAPFDAPAVARQHLALYEQLRSGG